MFSVWKKDANGDWVFDADGTNVASNDAGYLNGDVWSCTTTEDNQSIRICYCSEGDDVFAAVELDYPVKV